MILMIKEKVNISLFRVRVRVMVRVRDYINNVKYSTKTLEKQ